MPKMGQNSIISGQKKPRPKPSAGARSKPAQRAVPSSAIKGPHESVIIKCRSQQLLVGPGVTRTCYWIQFKEQTMLGFCQTKSVWQLIGEENMLHVDQHKFKHTYVEQRGYTYCAAHKCYVGNSQVGQKVVCLCTTIKSDTVSAQYTLSPRKQQLVL